MFARCIVAFRSSACMAVAQDEDEGRYSVGSSFVDTVVSAAKACISSKVVLVSLFQASCRCLGVDLSPSGGALASLPHLLLKAYSLLL
eukprot:4839104-Pleurochrysis_carterae.AAC.1